MRRNKIRWLGRSRIMRAITIVGLGLTTATAALADCSDVRGITPPESADLSSYSGYYVGGDGCFYDPHGIDVMAVPPAVGASGLRDERLIFVNGANPKADREPYFLRLLAEARDIPAVGVLNTQTDENLSSPPTIKGVSAVKTLESLMLQSLETGSDLLVRGGSAGASVVSVALARTKMRWSARHPRPRRLDDALRHLKVETFGGVGFFYPDGPRYVHYANLKDPNAQRLGVLNPLVKPGQGAVIALFQDSLAPLEADYEVLTPKNEIILSHHGFGVYNANQRNFDRLYRFSPKLLPYRVVPLIGKSF